MSNNNSLQPSCLRFTLNTFALKKIHIVAKFNWKRQLPVKIVAKKDLQKCDQENGIRIHERKNCIFIVIRRNCLLSESRRKKSPKKYQVIHTHAQPALQIEYKRIVFLIALFSDSIVLLFLLLSMAFLYMYACLLGLVDLPKKENKNMDVSVCSKSASFEFLRITENERSATTYIQLCRV